MTVPDSISALALKVSQDEASDIKEIVTKIDNIEDRMDCFTATHGIVVRVTSIKLKH